MNKFFKKNLPIAVLSAATITSIFVACSKNNDLASKTSDSNLSFSDEFDPDLNLPGEDLGECRNCIGRVTNPETGGLCDSCNEFHCKVCGAFSSAGLTHDGFGMECGCYDMYHCKECGAYESACVDGEGFGLTCGCSEKHNAEVNQMCEKHPALEKDPLTGLWLRKFFEL